MPVKHMPLDSNTLGKISKEQPRRRLPGLAHLAHKPGLGGVRRALRGPRHPGHPPEQFDAAMAELFATDGPAMLCVEQGAELL